VAFANSPPVYFTKNGKAFPGEKGQKSNLKPDCLDDYAQFLTSVLQHFRDVGVPFDYISLVNEPQWDWASGSQEGSPATNAEIFNMVKSISKHLLERDVHTKILVPEAGAIDHLIGGSSLNKDQVNVFWEKTSPFALQGLAIVAPIICAHGYYTTWPLDKLTSTRQLLHSKLQSIINPPAFWQSEYCILREDITEYGIGKGHKRDLGINTALFYARVIHNDLVLANAAAWQFWTALTDANYKDGLIYLDSGTDDQNRPKFDREAMKVDGNFHASKTLWALGNYSRFVRPGMQRIKVDYDQARNKGLLLSSYADTKSGEIVVVAVNYSEQPEVLSIDGVAPGSDVYTTSEAENLEKSTSPSSAIKIGRRSVVTITGKTELKSISGK
jgi:O-glycosyl hydrolase